MATLQRKTALPLNIKRVEKLSGGRFKIKLAENGIGLSNLKINGKDYDVLSSLGRGRFIVRAAEGRA